MRLQLAIGAFIGLTCGLFAGLAAAVPASEQLRDYLDGLKTLQGHFSQTVVDETGAVSHRAEGYLSLSRPDRFRWDYREPYEQLVVSDGEKVWFFDTDLEQITVKMLADTLGGSPASLLSSDRPVDEGFSVTDVAPRDGLEWVELRPQDGESQFDIVHIGFSNEQISRMEMTDAFGQVTRVDFSDVRRNVELEAGLFSFTPPAGIDVIGP